MASVTIRNLDDAVKESARLSAARNGRSLEEELRALLKRTYAPAASSRAQQIRDMPGDDWVRELIEIAGGVGMDLPSRQDPPGERKIFGAD